MSQPTARSVLGVLAKPHLIALGRDVDVTVPPTATKEAQIAALVGSGKFHFRELLRRLGRDDLKAACRAHEIDDSGRAREQLSVRLLAARGGAATVAPTPLFSVADVARYTPRKGDIVLCRHRQWLVEDVLPASTEAEATRVKLVCLDDDNQGRALEVLWELELGARVHRPEAHGLGEIARIDPPRHFAAYLHALKWNAVTATDGRLFQSPFRAGIILQAHQLVPLQKALALPRANLFIADDVGLGKTIEAGLILSELMLRQRVDLSLIICPAAVCLQWRDEMWKRFGIRFEVMSRAFVARRRRERGFGVNPWATHARFIISHQLIRRPEYRDPLLAELGERAKKSLLIVDEAHAAAPATASKYAVDSKLTTVMRDIAPRFENRLFLSATPHNGHSNSFSALLELLDPQRFTRGVKVHGAAELQSVMVRRLKQDLREALVMKFPERRVIQLNLTHRDGHWQLIERAWDNDGKSYRDQPARDLGPADPFELTLSEQLARYTELCSPKTGRGKLVFINLQKRLLSGVEAFARTLRVHARSLAVNGSDKPTDKSPVKPSTPAGPTRSVLPVHESSDRGGTKVLRDELAVVVSVNAYAVNTDIEEASADDEFGPDDETLELFEEERIARESRALQQSQGQAREMLDAMLQSTESYRLRPDAKVRALVDWISRNQCAGVRIGGVNSEWPRQAPAKGRAANDSRWNDQRLIIFTEYGDTKRYLMQILTASVAGTDRADDRILAFHGGMSDEQREEVQRAFNSPPADHPVRILVATDAAREGINLQAFCADLVHFDVPWNPARMEQRNGRIDRVGQSKSEVFCRYFTYSQREADPVLATLVEKVEVITRELGSLGAVVMDDIEATLEKRGVTAGSAARLQELMQPRARSAADDELESTRQRQQLLKDQVEDASAILERSRKVLQLDQTLLRDALDVGFELAGAGKLVSHESQTPQKSEKTVAMFTLPALPESWQNTLDTLRPARGRDQSFWDFRKQPPMPVCFDPPPGFASEAVQLHLQHPLVQRVLGRFIAQGFSTNDLSRVTVLCNRHDALVRVIAFGRLSLFGAGAARLHDELISVAARWLEGKKDPLRPFADEGDRKAIDRLEEELRESPSLNAIPKAVQQRVRVAAPELFAQLWKPIREEADARAMKAIEMLKARGHNEADQLREILRGQRAAIERQLKQQLTLPFEFGEADKLERKQFEADAKHMASRLARINVEIEREPPQIEELYRVALNRLTPVGLVVLWPQTRI